MSIIEASSGTYRSRVDGTIVLSVEIEPRFRAEALALFGMPGTPLALAALKPGTVKSSSPVGTKCLTAIELSRNRAFWTWVGFATMSGVALQTEAAAANFIRKTCGIESRRDLDGNEGAYSIFTKKLLTPFTKWAQDNARP